MHTYLKAPKKGTERTATYRTLPNQGVGHSELLDNRPQTLAQRQQKAPTQLKDKRPNHQGWQQVQSQGDETVIQRRPWKESSDYGRQAFIDTKRQLLYFPESDAIYDLLDDSELIEHVSHKRKLELYDEIREDIKKYQSMLLPDDVVTAYYKGYYNYGMVMADLGKDVAIKTYEQVSGEGKIVGHEIREIIVPQKDVKRVSHTSSKQKVHDLKKKQDKKEEEEVSVQSSTNKDNWKSEHVNKAIQSFQGKMDSKLLDVVHHKVPRQLMIDFFSRLSDSQRFTLQSKLDVTGRKEFLSMGSNLQLGPKKRSDETPDVKHNTKSGEKYIATFDPNKLKSGELDKISALYKGVYQILLDVFKKEPEEIDKSVFQKVLGLMYQAEVLHYANNKGQLLESPSERWEDKGGTWNKVGRDLEHKDSDQPLRNLKDKSLRADFERQQNIKSGQNKYSISYYDANADIEERLYFGDLKESDDRFLYFDHKGKVVNQEHGVDKK